MTNGLQGTPRVMMQQSMQTDSHLMRGQGQHNNVVIITDIPLSTVTASNLLTFT